MIVVTNKSKIYPSRYIFKLVFINISHHLFYIRKSMYSRFIKNITHLYGLSLNIQILFGPIVQIKKKTYYWSYLYCNKIENWVKKKIFQNCLIWWTRSRLLTKKKGNIVILQNGPQSCTWLAPDLHLTM